MKANYATAGDNTYQYSVANTLNGGTWNNTASVFDPRLARFNLTFNV